MKGAYLLIIELDREITIKNRWNLKAGLYVYVGSAMSGLIQRISRHMKKDKREHWHIDHLLRHGKILSVIMFPSEKRLEEEISRYLSRVLDGPRGFGSSDLKVRTNLYKIEKLGEFFELLGDFVQNVHENGVR